MANWNEGWVKAKEGGVVKTFDTSLNSDDSLQILTNLLKARGIYLYDATKRGIYAINDIDNETVTITMPKRIFDELQSGVVLHETGTGPVRVVTGKTHGASNEADQSRPGLKIFDDSASRPMFANKADQDFVQALVKGGKLQSVFVLLVNEEEQKRDKYTVSLTIKDLTEDEAKRLAEIIHKGTGFKFKVTKSEDEKISIASEFRFSERSKSRHSVGNCAFITSKMLGDLKIANMSDLRLNAGVEISRRE